VAVGSSKLLLLCAASSVAYQLYCCDTIRSPAFTRVATTSPRRGKRPPPTIDRHAHTVTCRSSVAVGSSKLLLLCAASSVALQLYCGDSASDEGWETASNGPARSRPLLDQTLANTLQDSTGQAVQYSTCSTFQVQHSDV
jgi:hypothetical protein